MEVKNWFITDGNYMAWYIPDMPVLALESDTAWDDDNGFIIGISFDTEDDKYSVEIDGYDGIAEAFPFRRMPSARAIMRDPELREHLEKRGVDTLPEIPTDLKERFLATVEDWKASKSPAIWEVSEIFRRFGAPEALDDDTYHLLYTGNNTNLNLEVLAEAIDDYGNIKWKIYFIDENSEDVTDEVMEKLGLESIRTFADDEKDFLETLKLVLPADEAKKAIRDLLIALR